MVEFTPSLQEYLLEAKIPLRLSCIMASGWPLVLSLWYLYEDGFLYCATPQSAKVVSYLLAEPRCSFEVAADLPPYCGVRGRSLATIDQSRGLEILERLLVRYLGNSHNPLARNLLQRQEAEVAIRIEPQTIYTWNFSDRMADSLPRPITKICPK